MLNFGICPKRNLWVKNVIYDGRQSLDLTKQQKTTFGHAFRFLDFHEFWLFWFESKCKMFLDTSNFSKTQLRNSLKVLKHTFSSVKVKHFLSLKNDDFEFNTVLARAGVRAARSNYILEKFNISAFTGKKNQVKSSSGSCFTAVLSPPSYPDTGARCSLRVPKCESLRVPKCESLGSQNASPWGPKNASP